MTLDDGALDAKLASGLEPAVVEALAEWQNSTGVTLSFESWLTAGHTRAKVAVVLAAGTCNPTKVILKACPPDRLTSREPRLHSEALSESPPTFVEHHLVQQPFDTVESSNKWRVLFQTVAGDSLRAVRPLDGVIDDDRLPELLKTVAASLLWEWNPDFQTHRFTPPELLHAELGTKADRNGPLIRFLEEMGIEESPWMRFPSNPGLVVPNAILWSLKSDLWPAAGPTLWAHLGRTHGDLHPGNVLIKVQPAPRAEEFRLIDLSAYSPRASLAKDVAHLLLSIVGADLPDSPAGRRQLVALVVEEEPTVPLQLSGLRQVVTNLRQVGRDWQTRATTGLQDDWDDQFSLAIVSESLQFVGRKSLPTSHRLWFLEVASTALGLFLASRHVVDLPQDPARVALLGDYVDQDTEAALEQLLDACGHFSGTHATIAVVAGTPSAVLNRRIGGPPWTAVMSFDPGVDEPGGALAVAKQQDRRLNRLVTAGQTPEYGHGSTVWHALGGLVGESEPVESDGLRAWRRRFMRTIEGSLAAMGRFTARPVTVVVFGEPDERVRALVEAIDDRFEARSRVLLASQDSGTLREFVDLHLAVQPDHLLSAMPTADEALAAAATVPGHAGRVLVESQDLQWLAEMADLLTSISGTTAEGIEDVGHGFLQGREVTWFELSLNLDVVPPLADDLQARVQDDLGSRDTRRISLFHYPGAGGSTLARRVAWQTHLDYPTLYCPGIRDEAGLALRVERLAKLTGMPVLLVLEQVTDVVGDRLFNRLRSDSVPVVILTVSRRAHPSRAGGSRSFYLGYASTRSDVSQLRDRFTEYAPHRRQELAAIREGTPSAVPFIFGLLAFQEKYLGLEEYVRHSVARLDDQEKYITMVVALSHRYAGISVAEDLFANMLAVAPDSAVDLSRLLSDDARALLVEDSDGFWRTHHWLVSAEILIQLLVPGGDRESWKLGLSGLVLRVITEARTVFGVQVPDDIGDLLKRLFVFRENRELFGDERQRAFSDLIMDIPSVDGRLEVLRQLAESFPTEPHFWAHYGRLLSYEAGDTQKALEAINQALSLDTNDPVFFHIRGMVHLRELRDLRRPNISWDEQEVIRLTELALADFAEAAELDDDSEYPHVASIRIAVEAVEMAAKAASTPSLAAFLAKPSSGPYRNLLGVAEDALGSIREIRGADPLSSRAEAAEVSLSALYDDYLALLQGWRNLLDRSDTLKGPVRRRLVHTYVRRAGDWQHLSREDQRRVLDLLEENLQDDPTDTASLRDWLRAARQGSVSLDRAGELVSYWAQRTHARDALYYDYVIAVLQVFHGRESNWQEARRKIDRCRERAVAFSNRKFSYEWLGVGDGLDMLVHHSQVPASSDLNRPGEFPKMLRRVSARISTISSPQAGILRLEPGGLEAFFVPARAGALRGRHENARVEATLGFSYDGLRAWSVTIVGSDSEPTRRD